MFIGKQAEKQEHVANPDALVAKVRLSRAALAEQALAICEHWIIMAKMAPRDFTPRNPLDNLAQP
jgi:hypothetical protein